MGLRESIARLAVRGSHVLVVEVPGWGETRMRVEAELAGRGWTAASSPADADVLLVCGAPGPELLSVCDRVWSQLPGPRARATVLTVDGVSSTLQKLAAELLDESRQRVDARTRSRRFGEAGDRGMDVQPAAHAGGHESAETDMDMDMDMDMPMPGGIPLASGGPDRDGLEMDVLHVPLGPVLPHWPAGLVVRCALQGDVIVSADAEVLPAAVGGNGVGGVGGVVTRSANDERRRAIIRRSDNAVHVLSLAGWPSAAARARRIRDAAASGTTLIDTASDIDRLSRSVRRSWLLRWGLKGIMIDAPAADPTRAAPRGSDEAVRDRLIDWLDQAARIARDAAEPYETPEYAELQRKGLAAIPRLLSGTDIGSARLIVAGLAIDTAAVAHSRESFS